MLSDTALYKCVLLSMYCCSMQRLRDTYKYLCLKAPINRRLRYNIKASQRYISMRHDPIISLLLSHLLPSVVNEHFDLVNITEEPIEGSPVIHLHLEETNNPPESYPDAIPNGFYEASIVGDFPMRDKAVMLHLKRRRWKDPEGRSVPSRTYQLAADGTRLSCEFADFLKDGLG